MIHKIIATNLFETSTIHRNCYITLANFTMIDKLYKIYMFFYEINTKSDNCDFNYMYNRKFKFS